MLHKVAELSHSKTVNFFAEYGHIAFFADIAFEHGVETPTGLISVVVAVTFTLVAVAKRGSV